MAENPLLPHRRLKALHKLMQRIRALGTKPKAPGARHVAVLASAFIQLEAGDILCCSPDDLAIYHRLQASRGQMASLSAGITTVCPQTVDDLPVLCTLLSAGLKQLQQKSSLVAIVSANTSDAWHSAFAQFHSNRLPVVLVFLEPDSSRKVPTSKKLTWDSLSVLARKARIPTITADSGDAVALYRVIQESVHRAKAGDGAAIVWCSFPSATRNARATNPITTMENYLAARGLGTRAKKSVAGKLA